MTSWRKFDTPIKLLQRKQTRLTSAIGQITAAITNEQSQLQKASFLFAQLLAIRASWEITL